MPNWANKEALFAARPPQEIYHISDEIGDVIICGLMTGEKDDYENAIFDHKIGSRQVKIKMARAILLKMCVRDPHGKPFFAKADMGRVLNIPAVISEPIYEKARELSGLAVGEIEGMVKNSEATADDASGTGSPDISDGPSSK